MHVAVEADRGGCSHVDRDAGLQGGACEAAIECTAGERRTAVTIDAHRFASGLEPNAGQPWCIAEQMPESRGVEHGRETLVVETLSTNQRGEVVVRGTFTGVVRS